MEDQAHQVGKEAPDLSAFTLLPGPEERARMEEGEIKAREELEKDLRNKLSIMVEGNRKRGGQPGNRNARKHGFYAKYLTPEQVEALEEAEELNDFGPEAALLRVRLRDMLNDPDTPPEHITRTINSLCRVMEIQRCYRFG